MSTIIPKLSPQKFQLLQRSKERADICLRNREYDRAIAHMLIIFKLQPDEKIEMKNNFIFALGKYKKQLEEQKKWDDVFDCYKHALEIYPECECIHHDLGSYLFKLGHVDEAASYFRQSLTLNPNFEPAKISLENICNSIVERWHFVMLNDKRRNISFQQAIHRAIKEGCNNILDIGTGTGILSMIAARGAATNIFACEKSKVMYQLAQDIIKTNGISKRISLFHKESTNIQIPGDIPNRVSLVITEIFDAGLFGEHVLTTLHHAWKHLLLPPDLPLPTNSVCDLMDKCVNSKNSNSSYVKWKQAKLQQVSEEGTGAFGKNMQSDASLTKPREISNEKGREECQGQSHDNIVSVIKEVGRVIPNAARIWVCLIECHWIRQSSRMHLYNLNLANFENIIISCEDNPEEPYTTENLASLPGGYTLLTDPTVLLEINFNNPSEIEELITGKIFNCNFVCKKDGSLDAVAVWFDLFVDKHTTLSTNPGSGSCWEQAIFPICPHHIHGKSLSVRSSKKVNVQLACEKHLKFKSIELVDGEDDQIQERKYIFLDCKTIQKISDDVMNASMISAIHNVCSEIPSSKFIDMTQFAWPAIFACKLGAASIALTTPHAHLWDAVSQMHERNCLKKDCLICTSVEQLSERSGQWWDVLFADPIEPSGLMRSQVLEDIALLKASCLKQTSVIFPGKLRAYVMLIQSALLLSQSKIIDDSYTLNFKVAEYVNLFQARIHQDIQLSTLPHEKLSHPTLMWEIDFNEPVTQDELPSYLDIKTIVEMTVIKKGDITGLIYWFVLDYGNGNSTSTMNPACSWRQAAVMLNNSVHVCNGERITLTCLCKQSVVDIHIQTIDS